MRILLHLFCALTFMLLLSCVASKKVVERPPLLSYGLTLAKSVIQHDGIGVPDEITDIFSSEDKEAIAFVRFDNLSGQYRIRWDWYAPDGSLYLSSGDFTVEAGIGKFFKTATTWHALTLRGDKAAELAGRWRLDVYLNEDLLDSRDFTLQHQAQGLDISDDSLIAPETRHWGLIIGLENYADGSQVSYALKDCRAVKKFFIARLGVPEENITELINTEASKSRIEDFLKYLLPPRLQPQAVLYIYFVGQGAIDAEGKAPFLLPYESDLHDIDSTGYLLEQFYQDVGRLTIKTAYIFLDAGFTPADSDGSDLHSDTSSESTFELEPVDLASANKMVSIAGARQGQVRNCLIQRQHGLFTYYLLRAIKGEADTDQNQQISILELYEYLDIKMNLETHRMGVDQDPAVYPGLDKTGDLEILPNLSHSATRAHYRSERMIN